MEPIIHIGVVGNTTARMQMCGLKKGREIGPPPCLTRPPCRLFMSKRNLAESRLARKRRKEGSTHATLDLDAMCKRSEDVESIRVWQMSTSETTGRVLGARRTLEHAYESSPGPSRHESHAVEAVEAVETPTDSVPSEPQPVKEPKKSATKRRRVRITQENDSVSTIMMSPVRLTMTRC